MNNTSRFKTYKLEGMSCVSCENKVKSILQRNNSIEVVSVSYENNTITIKTNNNVSKKTQNNLLKEGYVLREEIIEDKVSNIVNKDNLYALLTVLSIIAVYFLVQNTIGFNNIPEVTDNMSYVMLFIVGVFTSLHCIAMCGGINLSQSISSDFSIKPSILYNTGRIISYTIIGGIVGGIGSIFNVSNTFKGSVQIVAGAFMLIMGLNMLNISSVFRKMNITFPQSIKNKLRNAISPSHKSRFVKPEHRSLLVGLANGFMPCGPLQTIQIYALGSGSILNGAISMFAFSIGTVPLMLGFGLFSNYINKRHQGRLLKVSAILVLLLGIVVINRGLSFYGVSTNIIPTTNYSSDYQLPGNVTIINNVQVVDTKLTSYGYENVTVKKGFVTKLIISADETSINYCNNRIIIPELNIESELKVGRNVIEFTPTKTGDIVFTCWMGMLRGNIKVVD